MPKIEQLFRFYVIVKNEALHVTSPLCEGRKCETKRLLSTLEELFKAMKINLL